MHRPATFGSRRGLLLIEAVLSAVVIAVGLAFISRALSSQLGAVRAVRDSEELLQLARGKLEDLEAERVSSASPSRSPSSGTFTPEAGSASGRTCRWAIGVTPLPELGTDEAEHALFDAVTLTVQAQGGRRASVITLTTIWTAAWVPQEWLN